MSLAQKQGSGIQSLINMFQLQFDNYIYALSESIINTYFIKTYSIEAIGLTSKKGMAMTTFIDSPTGK